VRVYHFVDQKFGLCDIRRRRLKVSTLDNLNDPFELIGLVLKDETLRSVYLPTIRELAKTTGILCFSRRRDNPVQWAHYADRHRGICLGFDVPDRSVSSVMYRPSRTKLSLEFMAQGGEDREQAMRNILITKYSQWRYEDESRAFVHLADASPDGGLYFWNFNEDMTLREVLVGCNSNLGRAELRDAIGDLPNVTTKKMRPAFASFRMVEQRKQSLWV
jgi:hypothetical protein